MSAGKVRRGAETGQLNKIKTAVKSEKKRARAQASAEKKLRTVKPAVAAATPATAPAPAAAAIAPGFPVLHPALAALAPGFAKLAADANAPKPDFERIAYNMARLVEQGGKALAASLKPPEKGEQPTDLSNELQAAIRSISKVTEHWFGRSRAHRRGAIGAGGKFSRLVFEYAAPARRRDRDAARSRRSVRQEICSARMAREPLLRFRASGACDLGLMGERPHRPRLRTDPRARAKAKFYLRQISSALAPTNFFATNPEVLRETLELSGENLVRGASMLAEDIEAGRVAQDHPLR